MEMALQDDGDTEEARRLQELAEQTVATAKQAHQQATGARELWNEAIAEHGRQEE
jgi:hypothetical protein